MMAMGVCRHCGAQGIATDALICRECGGWKPNPGLFTRLGAAFKCIVGLALIVAGVASILFAGVTWFNGGLTGVGVLMVLWSLYRPYGNPPV